MSGVSYSIAVAIIKNNTRPKINIEPESDGLEDDFPFQTRYFQVAC